MGLLISGSELLNPLIELGNSFVEILPGVIVAIIILMVGYGIGYLIGHAIRLLLEKIGLDKKLEKTKVLKSIGKFKLSALVGEIVKWYIFIVFLQAGSDVLKLGALSSILNSFVLWLPNLLAAIIILFAGLLLAQVLYHKVKETSDIRGTLSLGNVLRTAIIIIAVVIALDQIGIEISFLKDLILVLVAAIGVGLALAIGISFGLGGKEEAAEYIKKMKKKF
ncbi:MAG: hypothetical protein PHT54_03140 [Candidatus Nanoarchaeia archaeon]|nr:hypothetical protein [Candidatus Nanoarchaeia archaeon]